jgi:hypothetical protein
MGTFEEHMTLAQLNQHQRFHREVGHARREKPMPAIAPRCAPMDFGCLLPRSSRQVQYHVEGHYHGHRREHP